MDPFEGFLTEPASLHRYLYANANPATQIDPTGHFTISQTLSVTGMMNTLNTASSILNTAFRVYRAVETIKDVTNYARLAVKLIEALTAPTAAGAQASVLEALLGQMPQTSASAIAASFAQAADTIGDNWENMSKAMLQHAPQIAAEASAEATRRIPSYMKAEAEGRLKLILFTPSGPGTRASDSFINVGGNIQLAVSPLGGRLFGLGVRTSKANYDQVFRIDYWENRRLELHYHIYSSPGRFIWRP